MSRILDATRIIQTLATHTNVAVTRRSNNGYTNGIAVAPTTAAVVIPYAVIVPTSGRELQRLPEERRSTETRTVYTSAALLVGAQAGANNADLVTLDGSTWEVQIANDGPSANGFFASIIQRAAVG